MNVQTVRLFGIVSCFLISIANVVCFIYPPIHGSVLNLFGAIISFAYSAFFLFGYIRDIE